MTVPIQNTLTEVVLISFFLLIILILRNNKSNIRLIFFLLLYGTILEIVTAVQVKTYTYGAFNLMLFGIPVWVLTSWSLILYASVKLSNFLVGDKNMRPVMTGLLALSADMFMDPVSAHFAFWTWIYSGKGTLMGVPYGNFLGWFLVGASFSFVLGKIQTHDTDENSTYLLTTIISSLLIFGFNALKYVPMADELSTISFYGVILLSFILCASRCRLRKPELSEIKTEISILLFYYIFFIFIFFYGAI